MRYAFKICNNEEYMEMHCEFKVPQMPTSTFGKTPSKVSRDLKDKLLKCKGVKGISSYDGSCISIQRNAVFAFHEIKPEVVEVMRVFFNLDNSQLEEVVAYPAEKVIPMGRMKS